MIFQGFRDDLPEAEVKRQKSFLHKVKFFTTHFTFLISLWFGAFISMVNILIMIVTMPLGIVNVKGDVFNKTEIKKVSL